MYLADRIGFHIAATTLALYGICPLEGQAAPTPNTARYNGELIRYANYIPFSTLVLIILYSFPADFNCRFLPRGQSASNLLSSLSLDRRH